ncbi:MAG TPA: hypothetical protein DIU15_19360 [Deltaproteobacteria bacterium]|nr:hypothetical protein [Deltaproteobacteria bacterium]
MQYASLILLIISTTLVAIGLFPCLGWLNWASGPVCALTVVLGVVGLSFDREPESGETRHGGVHLAAVVGGTVLGVVAVIRCLVGAGTI